LRKDLKIRKGMFSFPDPISLGVLGLTSCPFKAIVISLALSISIPTAKAPASSAIWILLMISS
jgi:hypothetical protein